MIIEKNIYETWKKRFGYPTNGYEKEARAFARRIDQLERAKFAHIAQKISKEPIVFLGTDSLNLDQTQRMIEMLEQQPPRKRIFITPRIHSKYQKWIDLLFLRKMKLHEFMEKMDQNWLEKENLSILFAWLQKRKIVTIAVGSDSLEKEDRSILEKINSPQLKSIQKIVWMGPHRLASKKFHLSSSLKPSLFIFFQFPELRWKFSRLTGWQKISSTQFLNLDTSPLRSIEDFNSSLEHRDDLIPIQDFRKKIQNLTNEIAGMLGQKNVLVVKKIFHVFDQDSIQKINRLHHNRALFSFLKNRVRAAESAAFPKLKSILLCTRRKSHMAEEVAHHLRTSHRTHHEFGRAATILEEALAFFASLLIEPAREIPHSAKKMSSWDEVHELGYQIGFQLYNKWNQSRKNKNAIRLAWNMYPMSELEAEMMIHRLLKL